MSRERALALLKRARYALTWRAMAVRHWLWSRWLLIPRLRARGLLDGPTTVLVAHDGVVVLAPDRVLKGTLSRHGRVAVEFARYRATLEVWPMLADILAPLELREEGGASCVLMDRYRPVPSERAGEYAVRLCGIMRRCGRPAGGAHRFADSPEVTAGIRVLAELYGADVVPLLDARLARLTSEGRCSVGFAHGDFHSRNMMLDAVGGVRLIDMDCMRVAGIQELDAVNFVLEDEWSRSGRQWFEQIDAYLRDAAPVAGCQVLSSLGVTMSGDLAWLYILDRVGQETMNYGFQYLPRQLDAAVATLGRSGT